MSSRLMPFSFFRKVFWPIFKVSRLKKKNNKRIIYLFILVFIKVSLDFYNYNGEIFVDNFFMFTRGCIVRLLS